MENELNKTVMLDKLLLVYKSNSKAIWIRTAILTVLIAVYAFIRPHTFEANTSLMPPKQIEGGGLSSIISSMSGGMASGLSLGSIGQSSQGQLFSDIFKSRTVLNFIIDSLQIDKLPQFSKLTRNELILQMVDMVVVDVARSGVISFSVRLNTPYFPFSSMEKTAIMTKKIADLAVVGLDKAVRERITSKARRSREYIEREVVNYRKKLDSVDARLEEFQTTNKVLKIEEQTEALVRQTIELGLTLAKAETELKIAEAEYSPSHPLVKQLRTSVDELRSQYQKSQQGGAFGNDSYSISFDKIPNLARRYTNLIRDKKIFEQIIIYLETQRHQEAIEESKDVPVVQVLDEAEVPDKHIVPNKKVMIFAGFLVSFIMVVIFYLTIDIIKKYKLKNLQ